MHAYEVVSLGRLIRQSPVRHSGTVAKRTLAGVTSTTILVLKSRRLNGQQTQRPLYATRGTERMGSLRARTRRRTLREAWLHSRQPRAR